MVQGLPLEFDVPGESIVASYDYYDFGEGTGMRLLYAAKTHNDEILTQNQVYSHTIETSGTSSSPPTDAYENLFDVDFDLSAFNTPKEVYGTAYVNGCFDVQTAGTGANGTGKLTLKLRKWDGSTETEIASTDIEVATAHNDSQYKLYLVSLPITTKVHFQIGDVLRLTAMGYYKKTEVGTGGGRGIITVGNDPTNRDGTNIIPSTEDPVSITQTKIWIPFKIEN
jgi:hypothetical protein